MAVSEWDPGLFSPLVLVVSVPETSNMWAAAVIPTPISAFTDCNDINKKDNGMYNVSELTMIWN